MASFLEGKYSNELEKLPDLIWAFNLALCSRFNKVGAVFFPNIY
jgi:hypothetical protein